MTTDAYTPHFRLFVNGVERSLLGGRATISSNAYVATATLQLLITEGYPSPGDTVQVRAGFTYNPPAVFTGTIDTVLPQLDQSLQVQCRGALWRTLEPLGTTSLPATGGDIPIATYSNQAASLIISDLLRRAGVQRIQLQDSGKNWGVSAPIILYAKDTAASLIKKLDEAEYYRTFDGPDGTVYRIPWSRTPGATSRTWQEGTDLYTGRLEQTRTGTKNRVICTGKPQLGTTNIQYTPAAERDAPSPYVPNPPGYFALTYQNDLLEDGASCDAWAAAKLGELNRLTGQLPFELAQGDNTLIPGMAVALTSATLNVPGGARFMVEEVVHDFSSGFQTSGTLFMASEGAGWNPDQKPIAIFTEALEQETLADGSSLTVATVDGSASYDPDNNVGPTRGIVSYVWSGTLGTPVVVPGSGGAKAVYTTSTPASALSGTTITLTVTDNQGNTGANTLTIGSGSAPVNVRDLWSAENTALSYSGDGAKTWQDVTPTISAVGVCRISADTFTLAWDSSGVLWRVSTTSTGPTGASIAGLPFVTSASINTIGGASRCFAGCQNGAVYFSGDSGQTWTLLSTVPNGQPVKRIEESPFATGDLTAVTGPILYHSFSNGADWDTQYTAASGLSIADFFAGFGNGFLILNGPQQAGEPSRIEERSGNVAGDWPAAEKPAQPYALTLGVGSPVLCTVGLNASGNPATWYADSSGPFTFADGHYTAAWGTPRDLIRDGTIDGLVYGAADNALFKSADYFAGTAFKLKALSAGRAGKMIGYGALHAPVNVLAGGALVMCAYDSSGAQVVLKLTASGWVKLSNHPYTGTGIRKLLVANGTFYTWVTTAQGAGDAVGANNVWRSADGVTWTPLTTPGSGGLRDLAGGSDGALWGIPQTADAVYHSTDQGATWTVVQSGHFAEVSDQPLLRLAVSPIAPATVVVAIQSFVALSTDGLATHTMSGRTADATRQSAGPFVMAWLASGDGIVHQHASSEIAPQLIKTASWGTITSILDVTHQVRQGVPIVDGAAVGTLDGVYRSTDDGATWARESSGPSGLVVSYAVDASGNEYAGQQITSPAEQFLWQRAGGVWTNLTSSLLAAFPGHDYRPHYEGMVGL